MIILTAARYIDFKYMLQGNNHKMYPWVLLDMLRDRLAPNYFHLTFIISYFGKPVIVFWFLGYNVRSNTPGKQPQVIFHGERIGKFGCIYF